MLFSFSQNSYFSMLQLATDFNFSFSWLWFISRCPPKTLYDHRHGLWEMIESRRRYDNWLGVGTWALAGRSGSLGCNVLGLSPFLTLPFALHHGYNARSISPPVKPFQGAMELANHTDTYAQIYLSFFKL